MFLFISKKERIKKAELECSKAVIMEYEEKIQQSVKELKESDNNIDVLKNSFRTLNTYLEAIVTLCKRHIDDKMIRDKVNNLYSESQKIKIDEQ
jgi:predicted transcriptional regulator